MPMWMTEWGFYSGAPTQTNMNGVTTTLPNRTEEEQTALHIKFYAWGKANNLTAFFYDLQGAAESGLGSAGLVESSAPGSGMIGNKALRLYEYKFRMIDSAQQITFSTAGNLSLPQGHIRIFKRGVASDVLWGLTALPAGITGRKVRTDIYGNADTLDAAQIQFPLGTNPDYPGKCTNSVWDIKPIESLRVSPNPAQNLVCVSGYMKEPSLLSIAIVNVLGQEVMRFRAEWVVVGEFSREMNVANLPQGAYLLQVRTPLHAITRIIQIIP